MNFSKKNHEHHSAIKIVVSKTKLTLILFLVSTLVIAQQGINYKALIKDDLGNVVAEQEIDVKFSILEGTNSNVVYIEDHANVMTNANGIVILNIGLGTSTDVFADINWGNDLHSLKIEIDLNDDGTFEFVNTTQFMAVPYAMHAKNLDAEALKIDDLSDAKSDADGLSLFLGIDAGLNDDGSNGGNISIGYNSMYSNTSGNDNIANGNQALYSNIDGDYNVALYSIQNLLV